jgi:hypothetical protein
MPGFERIEQALKQWLLDNFGIHVDLAYCDGLRQVSMHSPMHARTHPRTLAPLLYARSPAHEGRTHARTHPPTHPPTHPVSPRKLRHLL